MPSRTAPNIFGAMGQYFVGSLSYLGKLLRRKDSGEIGQVRRDLLKAGLRKPNYVYIYTSARYLVAVFLPLAFSFYAKLKPLTVKPYMMMGFSIYLALVGFYLPKAVAQQKDQL